MDDFSELITKETKSKIVSFKKYINKITHNKRLKKLKRNLKKLLTLKKTKLKPIY